MAMATYLQLVSARELAKLRAQPTWINKVNTRGTYITYYACSINYFVLGDAYPSASRKQPLGGLLFGFASVDCETLENGNFGVVEPHQVGLVLEALAKLDLAAIRTKVEEADPDELEEAEALDYEILIEDDEPPADVIAGELESLAAFYKRAARRNAAIVSYTT
jgi:hypothetical protein